MGRWSTEEEKLIQVVRGRCAKELAEVIPFPEVVGDRRIIRFIRAKSRNANGLEQSIQLYRDFLIWRKENNVDLIRNRIVYEGYNNPLAFPHGQIILDLQPTIVIAPEATDKRGQPIVLEIFGRNPASLLDKVSISDYVQFLVYCLEFRAIVLEQISDSHEKVHSFTIIYFIHSNTQFLILTYISLRSIWQSVLMKDLHLTDMVLY